MQENLRAYLTLSNKTSNHPLVKSNILKDQRLKNPELLIVVEDG